MKRIKLSGLLYCAALTFFLTSCNNDGTEDKPTGDTNTTTSTDTKTTEATTPVNTIVTTPENMVIVTHKVANFQKFLMSYEGHDSLRLANGMHSYVIGRGMTDSNMVMVVVKTDDLAKAKAFTKSPSLKAAMQQAGVTGPPTITFTTTTWQDTANIARIPRSMTTFTVKDWDAWQKNFIDGKQERLDNGITDRVIGHEADDNKKVRLVTALMDTAKAFAYYKSDALKKRREAGGVIGEPKRFLFYVVKRYN